MGNRSYDFIMRALINHPDCSLFALVDGLQYERYFDEEIKSEQGVIVPFLDTWPDSRIAFSGPWLYRLSASEHHREKLKELAVVFPSVSWLLSPLSLEGLLAHLKPFLNLLLPDGRCAFFRFYDPRVLKDIELLLGESDYSQLVKTVPEWALIVDGEMVNMKDKINHYR